ncbi:MAG: hypothetical protein ACRDKE_12420 [Solirubrobacterales bacterium]
MKSLTNIPSRVAALSAFAASTAMVVGGTIALTHEQSSQTTIQGTLEHIHIGMFTATQLFLIAPILYLAGRAGKEKWGIAAAVAGVILSALTISSNVTGEDASFFFAVAGPTNLTIFASLIAIGVGLYKKGLVDKWLAIALPATYFVFLPGHDVGGPFLTAACWITVGWMIGNDALEARRPGRVAIA